MDVQIIHRDGEPQYAVLAWADYQALLKLAGVSPSETSPTEQVKSPNDDLVPLAQLRTLRENKGLSAEKLARTVGISPSYLGLIETGERLPDAAILRSLAWELGIPGWENPA